MHAGTIILDGFNYEVQERRVPAVGPDGLPSGQMVDVQALVIVDEKLTIEVMFAGADWDVFKTTVNGGTVVVPTPPRLILPNANGG